MGNIYEDYLEGIDECPSCNSRAFTIVFERYIVCDKVKGTYEEVEQDNSNEFKIVCYKCGEVIREQD